MDNITHTLIGLVAGEAVARMSRATAGALPDATRRTALLAIGMIGGNLPDTDLLWSMGGDGLGYALHHRGHTHTLVGCVALALLLFGAVWTWLRWRGHRIDQRDNRLLGVMSVVSVLLHLGMDAMNSYGVHPFWPWDNRWYYGDAVFIVEPLYWFCAAPLLLQLRSLTARVLLALVLLAGSLAELVVHRFAPAWWAVPVLVLALAWAGRLAPQRAATVAGGLMAAVTAMFLLAHQAAVAQVQAFVQTQYPGFVTLDHVLTPSPSQPLCWDVVVVQRRDDDYTLRSGQFALTGKRADAGCPQLGLAPAAQAATGDDTTPQWDDLTLSVARLNAVVGSDCRARELMQFLRAPVLVEAEGGVLLADQRFGNGRGVGSLLLGPATAGECRYHVPWTPPRADLLVQ